MTVNVTIDLGYEFDVKASAKDVFAVLSDVPTSASHFPKVHQLVDLGDGVDGPPAEAGWDVVADVAGPADLTLAATGIVGAIRRPAAFASGRMVL